MTHATLARIVVGVDGSPASVAALHWAAAESSAHDVPLVVVHVRDPRADHRAPYARYPAQDQKLDDQVDAVKLLLSQTLTKRAEQVFEVGIPSQVLVRRSVGAQMLVLGHGDHHHRPSGEPFHDVPALGPVARACVAHADCAVVVVPVPAEQSAPEAMTLAPQRAPELVGARAVYPRVRVTSVC